MVVFFALFAFGDQTRLSNYNFLTPYSHAATHGFALNLAVIAALVALARGGRLAWACVAGACAGLTALTKPEMFLAAALTLAVGLPLVLWTRRESLRRSAAVLTASVSTMLLAPAAVFGLLATRVPFPDLMRGSIRGYEMALDPAIRDMTFFREGFGSEFVSRNAMKLLTHACLYGQMLLPAAMLGVLARRVGAWKKTLIVASILAGAAMLWLVLQPAPAKTWREFGRGVPTVVVMIAVASFVELWRRRTRDEKTTVPIDAVGRVLLSLFAVAMLLRMALSFRVYQYGFVQAAPAGVLCTVALVGWVPNLVRRAGGVAWLPRMAALGAIGGVTVVALRTQKMVLDERLTPLATAAPGDAMLVPARRGDAINSLLDELRRRARPGDTLAALPEAGMINFLTRRPNPTPYELLNPVGLIWAGDERRVLDAFARRPPNWIVIVHQPSPTFGSEFFGRGHGKTILAWINDNYDAVWRAGDEPNVPDSTFGIKLMRRR
jgi:hypothetical protein